MWCKIRLKENSLLSLHILDLILRHVEIYVNICEYMYVPIFVQEKSNLFIYCYYYYHHHYCKSNLTLMLIIII
jgi:hypothetical protein